MTEPILEIPPTRPSSLPLGEKKDLLRHPGSKVSKNPAIQQRVEEKVAEIESTIPQIGRRESTQLARRDVSKDIRIERLRKRTGVDSLTELPNRYRFKDALEKRVAEAKRTGKGFYLLTIDIDHFKDVNDVFGHPVGDELLKKMRDLREVSRLEEPIYRVGGDEFAQIIESAPEDELYIIADRYQEIVRKNSSEILSSSAVLETADPDRPIRRVVDLSIGFAPYIDGDSVDDIVNQADAAMYDSKKHEGVGSLAVTDTLGRRHYRQVKSS